MKLNDIIPEIKQRAKLAEIITALGVGEFQTLNYEATFRGVHGMHGSSSRDHCEVNPVTGFWRCFSCHQSGSVIDWVLSVKFGGNQAHFRDAVTWLAQYYQIEIADSPIDTPRHQAYGLLTRLSIHWNELLIGNEEAGTPADTETLNWIFRQWGLSRETIKTLGIGVARDLPDYVPLAEMKSAGLTGDDGKFTLFGRIVFPFWKDAQVQWIAGRYVGEPPEGKRKYESLFKTSYVHPTLYGYDQALAHSYETPLIITEGLGDAARAYQEGLRVVALGTTQLRKEGLPSLVKLCKAAETKYLILDSEASGAGLRGARATAQTLIGAGFDPMIVQLPRGDKDKVDLASFLQDPHAPILNSMLVDGWSDGGVPFVPESLADMAIRECPERPEADRLNSVMYTFSPLQDAVANRYINNLHSKTKLAVADLKKMLEKLRKRQEKTELVINEGWQPTPFMGQDFTYHPDIDVWRAHITHFVPCVEKVIRGGEEFDADVMAAIYVTVDQQRGGGWTITKSDKFTNPSKDMEALMPHQEVMHSSWSVKRDFPNSVVNFVEGEAKNIEVGELYRRVYNLFDKYVIYPEPRDKHVLTLFTFLTYIFMGFDAVPYLHANGTKDSGKSTTLQLLAEVCFNRVSSSQISAASGFRIIHNNRPTFIMDEAERLRNPKPESNDSEILAMSLAGYKKTDMAKAYRCAKEDNRPVSYFTYCPKVYGSIAAMGDVLGSRLIVVQCRTARPEELKNVQDLTQDAAYLKREYQEIRDALHVWALTEFRAVRERYDTFTRNDYPFLSNRDRELWLPLLAIAEVIDSVAATDVARQVGELSGEKLTQAKVTASDFGIGVLKALWNILQEHSQVIPMVEKDEHQYLPVSTAVNQIRQHLIQNEDWDDKRNTLNAKFLTKILRDVGSAPMQESAIRLRNGSGERTYFLKFDPHALESYLVFKGHIEPRNEELQTA